MAIMFFNPTAPEGIAGAQWDLQSANTSTSTERVSILGSDGDEHASMLYGERTTVNCSYVCNAAAGEALDGIPPIGTLVESGGKTYHVDSVTLTFSATAAPTMEVAAHYHGKGDSHGSAHRTYSLPSGISSTLTGGVGVPVGIAGLTFGSNLTDGFSQVSIALTANHVEAPYVGNPPAIPASDNHDGNVTVSCDIVGSSLPTAAESMAYDNTDRGVETSNTSNTTSSVTFVKHLQADA